MVNPAIARDLGSRCLPEQEKDTRLIGKLHNSSLNELRRIGSQH